MQRGGFREKLARMGMTWKVPLKPTMSEDHGRQSAMSDVMVRHHGAEGLPKGWAERRKEK